MLRGAEVDVKNEGGMQWRVVGKERACTRHEMETNDCTDRKHMKNQFYCLPDCNNYRVAGKYCGCFWGKHVAAEVNIPLESMEKCIGKKQTVWRGCFLLMHWGAEAGVMEWRTEMRVDDGEERTVSPEW